VTVARSRRTSLFDIPMVESGDPAASQSTQSTASWSSGPPPRRQPLQPPPTISQRPRRLQRRCCKTAIRTALAASTARLIRPPAHAA